MPITTTVGRKSMKTSPWWLEPGTEICPACGHTYVIQTEYRCVECDGAICAMCVGTATATEVFCVGCDCSAGEEAK
jgi:hypothetical protein